MTEHTPISRPPSDNTVVKSFRELDVKLPDADLDAAGKELAHQVNIQAKTEAEKSKAVKAWNTIIKEAKAEARALSAVVESGYRKEDVAVSIEYDYEHATKHITRDDTGETFDESMTADELERPMLPLDEGPDSPADPLAPQNEPEDEPPGLPS